MKKKKKTSIKDAPIKPWKDPKLKRKYLTEDEWSSVLEHSRKSSPRNEVLIRVMYECALRREEPGLIRLSYIKDIRKTNRIFIWRGKGSISGFVELTDSTKLKILDYVKNIYKNNINDEFFLFPGQDQTGEGNIKGLSGRAVYKIFNRITSELGILKHLRHPHVLKHSRIQHLLEGATSNEINPSILIQAIAQLVGHSTAQTTIANYMNQTSRESNFVKNYTKKMVE